MPRSRSRSSYIDELEVGFYDAGRHDLVHHVEAFNAGADYICREAPVSSSGDGWGRPGKASRIAAAASNGDTLPAVGDAPEAIR